MTDKNMNWVLDYQNQDKSVLEWALHYQQEGFSVVPVDANTKRPIIPHKDKKPLTEQEIKDIWSKFPNAGIALKMTNIFSLDIDTPQHSRNGKGADGIAEFRRSMLTKMPKGTFNTLTAKTPSGGLHFYFNKVNGNPNKTKAGILAGIDIQAESGNISIVPPTVSNKGAYTYFDNYPIIQDPPQELISYLDKLLHPYQGKDTSPQLNKSGGSYGALTSRGNFLVKMFASIPKGQRNNTLTSRVGSLFNAGIKPTEVYKFILIINQEACTPPLSDKEVNTIFRSIYHRRQQTTGGN